MVFASMRVGYKPIIIVLENENHDSRRYIAYMKRVWRKMEQREPGYMKKHWIYQQDGASIHKSKASMKYLYGYFGSNRIMSARPMALESAHLLHWAPGSPDISPLG